MVNQQLLDYVKQQADSGVSEEIIRKSLTGEGWSQSDIDEVFSLKSNVSNIPKPTIAYAGFWVRWAAVFLDSIIVFLGAAIVGVASRFIFNVAGLNASIVSSLSSLLSWIFQLGYFILMVHTKETTLGKMALGLIVKSEDGQKLSLGRIIIRETVGKFISSIIFLIGYLMVAFTEKKQGLHDKLAHSVVLYKDSNKKTSGWIVAAIIFAWFIFFVVIIGILSSVVLASLNTAKNKGNDATVKSVMTTTKIDALLYADKYDGLKGFQPTAQTPVCSGPLAINISDDGKNAVLFGKSCADKNKTFCEEFNVVDASTGSIKELDNLQSISGKISCE